MNKLPIGIQTFSEIIQGGYVYADKTGHIADLVRDGQYFFLSRPRRFGKSLFLDTIKEAFSGNRDLFSGLALAETDFDFTPRPVVRVDLSGIALADGRELREGLMGVLADIAESYAVEVKGTTPVELFRRLIQALHRESGQRVVVLVDEYDKPIIEHLDDPGLAEANRKELRYFYGVLKAMDAHLRFVLLTGVAKFTRTSIFSQLNNLVDITMRPGYADICGITVAEFDRLFVEHREAFRAAMAQQGRPEGGFSPAELRREILDWYDGYTWDGVTRVLNPFSLLNFFDAKSFYPFWFVSGTPGFLVNALAADPVEYAQIQAATITELDLDSTAIEHAPLPSLLFQTGFLTVTGVDYVARPPRYRLGLPNAEVSTSLSRLFLDAVTKRTAGPDTFFTAAEEAFDTGHPERLAPVLEGLFASIPSNLHQGNEAFYHAIFLAVMQFLGFEMVGEVAVAGGEVDGVVNRPNGNTYVIEMKYVRGTTDTGASDERETAALEQAAARALRQIAQKGYADRYKGTRRQVHEVGVAVAGRGRVVVTGR